MPLLGLVVHVVVHGQPRPSPSRPVHLVQRIVQELQLRDGGLLPGVLQRRTTGCSACAGRSEQRCTVSGSSPTLLYCLDSRFSLYSAAGPRLLLMLSRKSPPPLDEGADASNRSAWLASLRTAPAMCSTGAVHTLPGSLRAEGRRPGSDALRLLRQHGRRSQELPLGARGCLCRHSWGSG